MLNLRDGFSCALMILALSATPPRIEAACTIGEMAQLPVTMVGRRPVVPVKFNGSEALLVVDSGAFYGMLSPASAAEFRLKSKLASLPANVRIEGPSGQIAPRITTVDAFLIANVRLKNLGFFVGGAEPDAGAAGWLGQNILGIGDVEYDLANGAVRLMKPQGCGLAPLAYWATSASLPYGVIKIDPPAKPLPLHTVGQALLNGTLIRIVFDTGATTSTLTLAAARRAGIRPDSPGVVPAGRSSWIGSFASLKIGNVEMSDARLRFSDFSMDEGDMLLGADFFLSHRIYVANSQDKLYFTDNGGPPFDLSSQPSTAAAPGLLTFVNNSAPSAGLTITPEGCNCAQ